MHQELLSKTEKCILKFKEVHGNRYNYDKMVYIKNTEKVIITCKKHGDFLQTPNNHKSGNNCPKCREDIGSSKTTDSVIKEFKEVHGDRYSYDNIKYSKMIDKVIITCKEHGDFLQTPNNHQQGHGCPKCVLENKQNTEGIIEAFRKVHGDRYNYDKVIYKSAIEDVIITCKKHGDFCKSPNKHRQGVNCPKCRVYYSYYRDREYYEGKRTILYHIFLPEYNLYKIGLTISSVKQRFKYDKGLKYDILSEEVFQDGALAFDKEQDILNKTIEYEYLGEKLLKSGNTEIRVEKII